MNTFTLSELLEIENAGWRSLCEQRGGTFYGELMTPDAVMVLVNGMVMDRDTIAATMNDAPPWAGYELDDARVVDLGPDAAALVYRAKSWRDDGEEPFTALMSSVYRRIDGRPRLALYQQTTITH